MSTIEILNPKSHQDFAYLPDADTRLQAEQNSVLVFANELTNLCLSFPIVIQKNPENGRFCLVALLGLAKGENLFIDEHRWRVPQIPLALSRGPFALTYRQSTENAAGASPLIGVDIESPALCKIDENQSQGIPLFDGDSPSHFVEEVKQKLQAIHQGLSITETFLDKLNQKQLIEPVNINIRLSDTENFQLNGNYSVNEEKFSKLDQATLCDWFQSGEIKLIHLLMTSINHISTLIYLKKQRLTAESIE